MLPWFAQTVAQSTLPYSKDIAVKSLVGVGVGVTLTEGVIDLDTVIDGVKDIVRVGEGDGVIELQSTKLVSTAPAPVPE